MAGDEAAAPPPRTPLITCTKHVSQTPQYLYMCTNNTSTFKNESIFKSSDGSLLYRLQNNNGIFRENKVLTDAQGNVVLTAKKFPLSLAKWTICSPSGTVLAKTRTISGMAKYAVEVDVPSARIKPTFTVSPDLSNSQVLMWQNNGKGKEDTTMCTATYGANVALGLVSAAVQDWTYHIVVEPGADAALACCFLIIFTDLLEWNALGGAFGMN